jgi:selenocysteine-specific translation elongation factor
MAEQSNAHLCRGIAGPGVALAKQSKAQHCKAVELRRGDLQRKGFSVQSAEMLRRGKETLSIAMAKRRNAMQSVAAASKSADEICGGTA